MSSTKKRLSSLKDFVLNIGTKLEERWYRLFIQDNVVDKDANNNDENNDKIYKQLEELYAELKKQREGLVQTKFSISSRIYDAVVNTLNIASWIIVLSWIGGIFATPYIVLPISLLLVIVAFTYGYYYSRNADTIAANNAILKTKELKLEEKLAKLKKILANNSANNLENLLNEKDKSILDELKTQIGKIKSVFINKDTIFSAFSASAGYSLFGQILANIRQLLHDPNGSILIIGSKAGILLFKIGAMALIGIFILIFRYFTYSIGISKQDKLRHQFDKTDDILAQINMLMADTSKNSLSKSSDKTNDTNDINDKKYSSAKQKFEDEKSSYLDVKNSILPIHQNNDQISVEDLVNLVPYRITTPRILGLITIDYFYADKACNRLRAEITQFIQTLKNESELSDSELYTLLYKFFYDNDLYENSSNLVYHNLWTEISARISNFIVKRTKNLWNNIKELFFDSSNTNNILINNDSSNELVLINNFSNKFYNFTANYLAKRTNKILYGTNHLLCNFDENDIKNLKQNLINTKSFHEQRYKQSSVITIKNQIDILEPLIAKIESNQSNCSWKTIGFNTEETKAIIVSLNNVNNNVNNEDNKKLYNKLKLKFVSSNYAVDDRVIIKTEEPTIEQPLKEKYNDKRKLKLNKNQIETKQENLNNIIKFIKQKLAEFNASRDYANLQMSYKIISILKKINEIQNGNEDVDKKIRDLDNLFTNLNKEFQQLNSTYKSYIISNFLNSHNALFEIIKEIRNKISTEVSNISLAASNQNTSADASENKVASSSSNTNLFSPSSIKPSSIKNISKMISVGISNYLKTIQHHNSLDKNIYLSTFHGTYRVILSLDENQFDDIKKANMIITAIEQIQPQIFHHKILDLSEKTVNKLPKFMRSIYKLNKENSTYQCLQKIKDNIRNELESRQMNKQNHTTEKSTKSISEQEKTLVNKIIKRELKRCRNPKHSYIPGSSVKHKKSNYSL